jgi:hypothetical protein
MRRASLTFARRSIGGRRTSKPGSKSALRRSLEELSKVAFFSLGDVVVIHEDGTASLDLTETHAAHLAALAEVQIEERIVKGRDSEPDTIARTIKVKAHSKLDALDKLGRNLRLFTDKLEVSGGLDIASQLTAARRRAKLNKDRLDVDEDERNSTS